MTNTVGNGGMEANNWDSAELESAISGAPGADPLLVAFVAAVRGAANRPVRPTAQARHIAAAAAAAVHATAPPTPSPTVGVRWRRRISLAGLTSGLAIKMMIGTAALAAVGGGAAAATGNLPAPLQTAVSEAAGHVGLNLPEPEQAPVAVAPAPTDEAEEAQENEPADNPSDENKAHADEQRTRAFAYTAAVKVWTACVRNAASTSPPGEAFDGTVTCGDHPNPHDFGLPGNRDRDDKTTGPPDHSNAPDDAGPKDRDKDTGKPDDPGKPDKDPKEPKEPKDPKDPKDK